MPNKFGLSLRRNLLRLLLPPIVLALSLGAAVAYYVSIDVATEAHDQALADVALAISQRLRSQDGKTVLDLPVVAEQVLRIDEYDTVHFAVLDSKGELLGGEAELVGPPQAPKSNAAPVSRRVVFYDALFRQKAVRAVKLDVPCDGQICEVRVAETTVKRVRLAREILLGSLLPQILLAAFALGVLWFGVRQGLTPLSRLSVEISSRSPRDLRPIDLAEAPNEVRPLVRAINQLFGRVAEANLNQQRFLENAAHQLRTPLAGLQAHTELALAQPAPDSVRAELEQVHSATIRTARLANQLLALARAEPGGHQVMTLHRVDLRAVATECADEWVHRSLLREIDLGFDLQSAPVMGDAFLLRELLVNLIANAVEYCSVGGRITVRSARIGTYCVLEVEDDGPGIPEAERARVLERFYRLPGTVGTGSGLGLAIVAEIAALHTAQVEILDASAGNGCCVRVRFSAADA